MATPAATNGFRKEAELPEVSRSRVVAKLHLEFARNFTSGATYLARGEEQPPLKVVRAFSLPDGSALVHLHNVSGGLLGGDQLTQQIILGEDASVQVTTTGATRVYRHKPGLDPTRQHNEFVVGKNALLEYLPDATIPYAAARYQQHSSIHLEAGAGLFWWEILSPGREARGELFCYDEVSVRTRIAAAGKIIAAENLWLRPDSREVTSFSRFGPYRYLATFYICRVGFAPSAWRATEDYLRELTNGLTREGETLWGVSTLPAHGLVTRCLARGSRELLPGLQTIWRAAKRRLYDLDAIPPRKVN
jgi:urease accessory protein